MGLLRVMTRTSLKGLSHQIDQICSSSPYFSACKLLYDILFIVVNHFPFSQLQLICYSFQYICHHRHMKPYKHNFLILSSLSRSFGKKRIHCTVKNSFIVIRRSKHTEGNLDSRKQFSSYNEYLL